MNTSVSGCSKTQWINFCGSDTYHEFMYTTKFNVHMVCFYKAGIHFPHNIFKHLYKSASSSKATGMVPKGNSPYKLKHCLSLIVLYGKYGGLTMKYSTQLCLVLYLSLTHSFICFIFIQHLRQCFILYIQYVYLNCYIIYIPFAYSFL